jgi:hypothetical protein
MAIFIAEARVGIRFEEHGGGVDVAIENGKQKRCIAIFIAAIYILAPVQKGTHHIRFPQIGCILKAAPRHFATAQDSGRRRQRARKIKNWRTGPEKAVHGNNKKCNDCMQTDHGRCSGREGKTRRGY